MGGDGRYVCMVSIIIPVYNTRLYLAEALDSAISQSYSDLEIIVVDDGSTDGSADIIQRYALTDSRIKVIRQANGGLSAARNAALDVATGEWIVFLDSDDVMTGDAVATLLDAARKTGSDIAVSAVYQGYTMPSSQRPTNGRLKVMSPVEALDDILYQKLMLPSAWAKIFARSIFEQPVPLRFRPGSLYEDLDLTLPLFTRAKNICYTSRPTYLYRVNPNGITHTYSAKRHQVLDVTARIVDAVEGVPELRALVPAARDRHLSAAFNILGLLVANDALGDHPDVAARCRGIIRRYRWASLVNHRVRLKNKAGIIATYLLPRPLMHRLFKCKYS